MVMNFLQKLVGDWILSAALSVSVRWKRSNCSAVIKAI
jgi:hypothetical protein